MSHLKLVAQQIATTDHRPRPQIKNGWKQTLIRTDTAPEALSESQYRALPEAQRIRHDQERKRHHEALNSIRTTQMEGALEALSERLGALACEGRVAQPGLLLSGPAGSGKSTTLIQGGRDFDRLVTEARMKAGHLTLDETNPDAIPRLINTGAEYLPVAYFSLANQVVPTLENAVRFYNPELPEGRRYRQNDLLTMLVNHVEQAETKLILMDQVQNIAGAQAGRLTVSNTIKDIMDACPTTILAGAGIGLEHNRIFTEGFAPEAEELAQTGSRFALYPMTAYDISTSEGQQAWLRLLATVEKHLRLFNHEPKSLLGLSDYLYERTDGLTGSVMPLLRKAANRAITDGDEAITRNVVERILTSAIRDARTGHIKVDIGRQKGAKQPISKKPGKPRGKRSSHIRSTPTAEIS